MTVRRLGYPDVSMLSHWVDEYQRNNSLHLKKYRYSKYSDDEKLFAVEYYIKHDKNILQTVNALGYPSRPLLKSWIEEKNPVEAERRCQASKPHVRCTQEEREHAVFESCRGNLKIHEIEYSGGDYPSCPDFGNRIFEIFILLNLRLPVTEQIIKAATHRNSGKALIIYSITSDR